MKLWLISVGKPGRVLEAAIAEYESRVQRYWTYETIEVKEERAGRGQTPDAIRDAEAERLLKRAPKGAELIALTRTGDAWSSERLSRHIQKAAVQASPGIAFVIGGALGLGDAVLRDAQRRMRLSTCTFPHDLARLVLAEQLYRAGTIARGEPYHKGSGAE
ncbi:MAG TPA: 23S rRNA (pseudouridine(1915)-N(3))-methyltransferase RlmH [Longimicrobiales bacterium]|nr:23S rRNA (pseudouridine(1915)-N(3))-methyltransferase RlmH [Longimicrobiales bacterium]